MFLSKVVNDKGWGESLSKSDLGSRYIRSMRDKMHNVSYFTILAIIYVPSVGIMGRSASPKHVCVKRSKDAQKYIHMCSKSYKPKPRGRFLPLLQPMKSCLFMVLLQIPIQRVFSYQTILYAQTLTSREALSCF